MSDRTHSYNVPDISCDHCKRTIESHVEPLEGVEDINVDLDAKTVTVIGGDRTAIEAAIADAGYAIT